MWYSWAFIGSYRLSHTHMCSPIPIIPSFTIQQSFIHVHTCIHDCLVWFGSLLVNLGGFRGQILSWRLYASIWNPKDHKFSPLYYKYVPYRSTSCTLIKISFICTIFVCYFVLFCCSLAYFVNNLDCEYFSSSYISLWINSHMVSKLFGAENKYREVWVVF